MPVDNMIRPFLKELDFEKTLAETLIQHGWEPAILTNPTEKDLIKNWAAIIYNNNRDINRLGDFRLTDTEMQQVIDQVNRLKNPYERNVFINGGLICIKRDNPDDKINCGKEVYLKIFDAREIRAGQSVYQIVRQPKFETRHPLASSRRGDVMLLINGMPVIHIELKRSGVDVSQAVNQIKKYTHEGVFSQGLFSLVQVFVAMTPEKTLYFANPGDEANFSPSFYFHWADSNNDEAYDWKYIAANFLSIPMAHQLVGYYTIADDKDETLKVLRSYQYYATNKICDRVHRTNWDDHAHKGGFVWHTTGSGKTMTSFKAAQLIANAGDADKVIFLLDRIELSVQSLDEYRGFSDDPDSVRDTDDTSDLVRLLESNEKDECLIVTSLQKMSRVNKDHHVAQSTIDRINQKRVVFIVDECHRGVYGSMLMSIKNTFPRALLFGFTGTPVFEDNARGELTTEVIFGDMLHKYTLANGIPDGNVLGFDLYREDTFEERDIREQVAFNELNIRSVEEIVTKEQQDIYDTIMHETDIIKIEDRAKKIYESEEHHLAVVHKIVSERPALSRGGKFHAILATKSIPEAIEYYHLFKERYPQYNVAAIFDDSIDNDGKSEYKEDAILEMLDDYNTKFGTSFQQSTYAKYKKDVAKRLAHKLPYNRLEKDKQLDLLIVVTQMLTGYDSKWVNTLYVDKLLYYVDVIQAFSRTNRLFGPEKPFGIIKYFCRPNKMSKNIEDALELYVDQPMSVFTDKLEANLESINQEFRTITALFEAEGIEYFAHLPQAEASRKKFAKEFCAMTKHLEAAKMQGFTWEKDEYEFEHSTGWVKLKMVIDEETYNVLLQRYRELFEKRQGGGGDDDDVYQLEAYITETGAGTIDADYINSKFIRFVKYLYTSGPDSEMVKITLQDLHKAFASLSERDQRTALTIIHDIQTGDLRLCADKTIYDYINDYQKREADRQIFVLAEATGLDSEKLKPLVRTANRQDLNEHNRFDELMQTLDKAKGAEFLKRVTGQEVRKMFVLSNITDIVRRFILDASDRAKIIFAYQNDGVFLDDGLPVVEPEPEQTPDTDTTPAAEPVVNVLLSEEEMRANVRLAVLHDLRGIPMMPLIEDAVAGFFKVMELDSLPKYDGLKLDMKFVFENLYGRNNPDFLMKHQCASTLLVKYEVFLKKLYYLLNNQEVPTQEGHTYVSLANAIYQFDCLRKLRYQSDAKLRTLSEYLTMIRTSRNGENGAHTSMYMTEEELDKQICQTVVMYMYVLGMHWKDLKYKFDL